MVVNLSVCGSMGSGRIGGNHNQNGLYEKNLFRYIFYFLG